VGCQRGAGISTPDTPGKDKSPNVEDEVSLLCGFAHCGAEGATTAKNTKGNKSNKRATPPAAATATAATTTGTATCVPRRATTYLLGLKLHPLCGGHLRICWVSNSTHFVEGISLLWGMMAASFLLGIVDWALRACWCFGSLRWSFKESLTSSTFQRTGGFTDKICGRLVMNHNSIQKSSWTFFLHLVLLRLVTISPHSVMMLVKDT